MSVLVGAFVVQTALVYADDRNEPLGESAERGRRLWHENACQVCHQVWGNGGFLGPDLTNAASRVDDIRLASLLTVGSGQMPAFDFTPEQIEDMRAYLEALDRPDLGRGQLRLGDPATALGPWERFDVAVEGLTDEGSPERQGATAFRAGICSTCHLPVETNTATLASDLSTLFERIDEAELRSVLVAGRPERGMPPPFPAFTDEELDRLVAYFRWLGDNRDEVGAAMDAARVKTPIRWSDLPWWEYR